MTDEAQRPVCVAIQRIDETRRLIEELLGKEIQAVVERVIGRTPFEIEIILTPEEVSTLDDRVRTFVHTVAVRASVPRGW